MQRLNEKERAVLTCIRQAVRENGYATSVRDIVAALGYRSTSTIKMYLDRLEEYGYIRRENGKSRSITLCGEGDGQGIPIVGFSNDGKDLSNTAAMLPFVYIGALPNGAKLAAYPLEDGRYAVVLCTDAVPTEGTVAWLCEEIVKLQAANKPPVGEALGRVLAVVQVY